MEKRPGPNGEELLVWIGPRRVNDKAAQFLMMLIKPPPGVHEVSGPKILDEQLAAIEKRRNDFSRTEEELGQTRNRQFSRAYWTGKLAGKSTVMHGFCYVTGAPGLQAVVITSQDVEPHHMVLRQVLEEEPTPPRRMIDGVPRDLENICLRATSKEPSRRYPTAAAFADDLRRFLDGLPVQARPVSAAARGWRRCRRRPLVTGLVALLGLALTAGIVASTILWRQAEQERQSLERQRDRTREEWERAEQESKRLKWQRDRTEMELARAEDFRHATIRRLRTVGGERTTWMPSVRRKLLNASIEDAAYALLTVNKFALDQSLVRKWVRDYKLEMAYSQAFLLDLPQGASFDDPHPNYQKGISTARMRTSWDDASLSAVYAWDEMLALEPGVFEYRLGRAKGLLGAGEFDEKVEDAIHHL